MSDKKIEAIRKYLLSADKAKPDQVDGMHLMSHEKGKRAKRVIDMKRTTQDYYKTLEVQTPLLDHYENVDWYERDYEHDLDSYVGLNN